jgi:hypothetical protein
MDAEGQVRLIATEMVGEPDSIEEVRSRRLQGGLYTLFRVGVGDQTHYAIDILSSSGHAAMIVGDDQIEQIFGFEALPDSSD